ncbi:MAG: hypothetical protein SH857_05060 [Chitinophagales bacterium]|nr:hypothetical protein [Chitinophagales bacterium]
MTWGIFFDVLICQYADEPIRKSPLCANACGAGEGGCAGIERLAGDDCSWARTDFVSVSHCLVAQKAGG